MIIPLNNGKSITLMYVPELTTTNTDTLEQQEIVQGNNELTVGGWIFVGLVIVIFITTIVLGIKLLNDLFGGE